MSANSTSPAGSPAQQAVLRATAEAVRRGDAAAAMRLAAGAVANGEGHPQLLTLAAHEAMARGDAGAARTLAERALQSAPRNADAANALGLALSALNRPREAAKAFDTALRQMPNLAPLRFNKASALEEAGETKAARSEYERALTLQPVYPEALARLAAIAELAGDRAGARAYAGRALKQNPSLAAAALTLASVDVEEKNFADAIARATPVAGNSNAGAVNRAIAFGLIGDAYHGLGRAAEAFGAYTDSNLLLQSHFRGALEGSGVESSLARAERLRAYFETAAPWNAERPSLAAPAATHVFLVGFPRSGTTLLENVLAAHPEVEAMEERDCLSDAIAAFVAPPDGLQRLAALPPQSEELAEFRAAYWARASEEGFAPKRKVFIDKLPLNLLYLPLVAKLFPDAKILFALRDPRDVVLSCFRRRFVMSQHMYELLTLDGTARFYDAAMALAMLYRAKLGLDILDLKYESLVADFDGETARACAFLGIDLRAEMRDFAARARARNVNTPSARQLARGLYGDGRGQWRAYETQLAPVMPVLAPWLARFGYGEE